jgi:23S rRNA pseudouridine2605 synthase
MQKTKRNRKPGLPEHLEGIRLNRFLARAGRGSRRSCDDMVADGLVSVNGTIVRDPGLRLSAGDVVRCDSETVRIPPSFVLALNKPVGYETTMSPSGGRRAITELLGGVPPGAAPVGRLDVQTGGLLLLSNDGELIHRLTHPRWHVEREYMLILSRNPSLKSMERLRKGVMIGEGQFSKPLKVLPCGQNRIRLVLDTGRNREVRRMAMVCRLYLSGLERIRFGPVKTGGLARGAWRLLNPSETAGLYREVGLDPVTS